MKAKGERRPDLEIGDQIEWFNNSVRLCHFSYSRARVPQALVRIASSEPFYVDEVDLEKAP